MKRTKLYFLRSKTEDVPVVTKFLVTQNYIHEREKMEIHKPQRQPVYKSLRKGRGKVGRVREGQGEIKGRRKGGESRRGVGKGL